MTNAGFSFMRGQIESLRSMLRALYASEGVITHAELGVKFLALEAMMQRAEIVSATDAPAPFPMAALELKMALEVLGTTYRNDDSSCSLPAPST